MADDVVYIEPKMAQWGGAEMLHTVVAGQTLYSISQMYGIRLKALTRLNKGFKNKELMEGHTIRIR